MIRIFKQILSNALVYIDDILLFSPDRDNTNSSPIASQLDEFPDEKLTYKQVQWFLGIVNYMLTSSITRKTQVNHEQLNLRKTLLHETRSILKQTRNRPWILKAPHPHVWSRPRITSQAPLSSGVSVSYYHGGEPDSLCKLPKEAYLFLWYLADLHTIGVLFDKCNLLQYLVKCILTRRKPPNYCIVAHNLP
ncbi:hypothetical protein Bca4012_065552 [Brassica carinata]